MCVPSLNTKLTIYYILCYLKYPVRISKSQIQMVFQSYFLYLDRYAFECVHADFVWLSRKI